MPENVTFCKISKPLFYLAYYLWEPRDQVVQDLKWCWILYKDESMNFILDLWSDNSQCKWEMGKVG